MRQSKTGASTSESEAFTSLSGAATSGVSAVLAASIVGMALVPDSVAESSLLENEFPLFATEVQPEYIPIFRQPVSGRNTPLVSGSVAESSLLENELPLFAIEVQPEYIPIFRQPVSGLNTPLVTDSIVHEACVRHLTASDDVRACGNGCDHKGSLAPAMKPLEG